MACTRTPVGRSRGAPAVDAPSTLDMAWGRPPCEACTISLSGVWVEGLGHWADEHWRGGTMRILIVTR
eukprot:936570-Prorocentrum_minimum.AAC.4